MNIVLRPGEIVFEHNTFHRTFYFSDLSGFSVVLSHIIMWVLPFCQIGLVDTISKDWILPSFKTSYITFVPL